MKTFLITLVFLCGVAIADHDDSDNISVTINGRTYACSGSAVPGGGNIQKFCKCLNSGSDPGDWYSIGLFTVNLESGVTKFATQLTPSYGAAAACLQALKQDPPSLCR